MKEKIEAKIKVLETEKAYITDGVRITGNLAAEVQQIARTAFAQSQSTESIDERIDALIEGLQGVANHIIEAHNWVQAEVTKVDTKLEVLKSLVEEPVTSVVDDEESVKIDPEVARELLTEEVVEDDSVPVKDEKKE
jgi:hypothetical protein